MIQKSKNQSDQEKEKYDSTGEKIIFGGITKKAREFQKNICFIAKAFDWCGPKPLTVWTTTNSGKFFKRWEY